MQNSINRRKSRIKIAKLSPGEQWKTILLCLLALNVAISCNKFVDVPAPVNKITTQSLFKDDVNATSAVLGIYAQSGLVQLNAINGAITVYTGLSADELNYINSFPNIEIKAFQTNTIASNNYLNQSAFWTLSYKVIYQINATMEGITASNGITPKTKNQLLGECKVIRSLLYFYLIQLYKDVPLITTSDYNLNAAKGRSNIQEIYKLIISDLAEAKSMLTESYPSSGRLRINHFAASALLSRVYLYTGNWQQAETEATNVINSPLYTLQTDLNDVFLATSTEAIWQLAAGGLGINTREGATFVTSNPMAAPSYIITDQLLNAFEPNDPRKSAWIGTKVISGKTYAFPFKYKVPSSFGTPVTENLIVFRLAEQYLIRAEAKIRQGKTDAGINDLNMLRKRARGGNSNILPDLPVGVSQGIALADVLKERRIELMTEWGNRWFDLKRHQQSGAVLGAIKPSWQDTDTLFPVPSQEILLNKNLTQNAGYN